MLTCWATLINHKIPVNSVWVMFVDPPPSEKGASATSSKHWCHSLVILSLLLWFFHTCYFVFCISYLSSRSLFYFLHTDESPVWSQVSYTDLRWCNPQPIIKTYPSSPSGLAVVSDTKTVCTASIASRDSRNSPDRVSFCTEGYWYIATLVFSGCERRRWSKQPCFLTLFTDIHHRVRHGTAACGVL